MNANLEHATTLRKHYHDRLTTWELEFVRSLERQLVMAGATLSAKQQDVLDRLVTTYIGDGTTTSEQDLWR